MILPASTLMRLVAAWLVLVTHSAALRGTPGEDPFLVLTNGAFGASHLGLVIFFVLSGNLVAASASRSRGALDFASRRARRLGPGWIACWIAVCLGLGPLLASMPALEYWTSVELWKSMARMLGGSAHWDLPGVFESHALRSANGSLWTIPYEIAFYAVLGAATFGFGRFLSSMRVPVLLLWLSVVALLAAPGIVPDDEGVRFAGFRVVHLVRFGGVFAGGWALSLWAPSRRQLSIASAAGAIAWIASWNTPLLPSVEALVLPAIVVWLGGLRVGRLDRMWDISYGYYLWGWPVQQTLLHLWPDLSTAGVLGLATVATVVPATLSWVLVERRFLRRSWSR